MTPGPAQDTAQAPCRVLIVDDSALVRRLLARGLAEDPRIVIVGEAADAYSARDLMVAEEPDVLTLDVEMPRMNGLAFLRAVMAHMPTPTIVISSHTRQSRRLTMDALAAGAVDVIAKPEAALGGGFAAQMSDIRARVLAAKGARPARAPSAADRPAPAGAARSQPGDGGQRLICIGCSTGGVEALSRIMPQFPGDAPPILIVQHMPEGFTAPFADRLDATCAVRVAEARDGDRPERGVALIAPGGARHMRLQRVRGGLAVRLEDGPPVNYSRPAVDVLFLSVAEVHGRHVSAAILTGMGRDGAAGLAAIRGAGGRTCVQDEASAVVFGMPGAAIARGAAERVLPLDAVPGFLLAARQERGAG
jgi:two-component system chemotaxis response regulator CheB